jgi:hypothetical protein
MKVFSSWSSYSSSCERGSLLIAVAVGAAEGIHQITEGLVVGDETERDLVGELHGVARRVVSEGVRTLDDVLAASNIEVLPDGPDAIDHAVVNEEDGVVGGRVEVLKLRGTATEPVAATVHTHGVVVVAVALHELLEVVDFLHVQDQVGDLLVGVVGAADVVVKVTSQAATVVVELVLHVLEGRADGAKVGDEVAEGAGLHAATASTRLEVDVHGVEVGVTPASNVLAVATHRPLITVENFTLLDGAGVACPVPVRHVASVATLVPEVLLERVDEEAVPREEVGSHVDPLGELNVGSDVLVVTSEHTRVVDLLSVGHALVGDVVKALDGIGEGLALLLGHVPPFLADLSIVIVALSVAAVDVVTHAVVGGVGDIAPGLARFDVLLAPVVVVLSSSNTRNGGQTGQRRNEMHGC